MVVGVLSDTHDQLDRTLRAISVFQRCEAEVLVHCGDITTGAIIQACSAIPCHFVFGNHDSDVVPELLQAAEQCDANCLEWGGTFEVNNTVIGVTHGHLRSDVRSVVARSPHWLLTGHFHEGADWMEGRIHRICPGALHRAEIFTVATINLVTNAVEFHQVD
ncbi:metallophosphoesterase family protein [Aeoliella straminimaris]|uniref:metallophosphoesterase family protein n=1 Tax=Aeoliella straminimaris TaxID=2954799 RepID=UPI0021BCD97D|nr:metallophosphoesterase family protein [Aeoliella straminimaris]